MVAPPRSHTPREAPCRVTPHARPEPSSGSSRSATGCARRTKRSTRRASHPRARTSSTARSPRSASAFAAHVEFAEGEGGLFEELLDEAPTEAAQEVDRLKRDHEVIAATMDRVDGLLDEGGGLDDERLAEAAAELIRLLAQHRRHGAELLYNVYAVDTGAGD